MPVTLMSTSLPGCSAQSKNPARLGGAFTAAVKVYVNSSTRTVPLLYTMGSMSE